MNQKFESILSGQSILLFLVAVASVLTSGRVESADNKKDGAVYHAYFLGVQSNMVGFGYSDDVWHYVSGIYIKMGASFADA